MTLLAKWRLALHLATDARLSRADLAIGLLLLDRFNPAKGYAWPSLDWLAAAAHVDRSTATRSVGHLISLGYFVRASGGGRGRSTRYRPCWGNRCVDAPVSIQEQARGRAETGASAHENRRADRSKQAHRRTARPLRNTFTNPASERGTRTLGEELSEHDLRDIDQPKHRSGDRLPRRAQRARIAPSLSGDLREWQPSRATAAWASEHAAAVADPTGPAVVERFRNYWLARGRKFADIDAAFRAWLADEAAYAARRQNHRSHSRDEIISRAKRAAQAAQRGGK